jgi:hypothetical protein
LLPIERVCRPEDLQASVLDGPLPAVRVEHGDEVGRLG